ncbi:2-dehydropantoate 2-reductase [Phaeosphaeriaceae sp. PMI808]|nr:2-dehydropantoate 2-reductase [Phaeosphaeriaceae sp. PMI808]
MRLQAHHIVFQLPFPQFSLSMASEVRPKVLLFGAGSVGTVYLWLLSKVADTTTVCRSNYDVAIRDGFVLNSSVFGQNIRFRPKVVRDCDEAASRASGVPYDYLVVCTKAIAGKVPELIAPAVTPGKTAIVLIQNGVGIEQEYFDAFSSNPIISTVAYLPVTQRPAGVVKHGETEKLHIGIYPTSAPNEPAKTFTALIQAAGGTSEFHDDVQFERWFKLLVNASWNPICALTLSKDTEVLESCGEASSVLRAVMLEIRDIASAHGHSITTEKVEFQLNRAQARIPINAGIEPSMLQDVQASRQIEVEAILGNVVRMGRVKGVKCDRLEVLYVLTKALDLHIGRK